MKNVIFDLDMTLVDSSIAESARKQRNWQLVYSMIPSFSLYSGMGEVFDFIRNNNIRVAIVSTSPRPYVERVCRYFNIPTNAILGYHDCGRIKPAPDGMIRALKEIGSLPQDTVSFGDRAIDIQASNAAGVKSVACLWGTSERFALASSNPSETILSPNEIITLIR